MVMEVCDINRALDECRGSVAVFFGSPSRRSALRQRSWFKLGHVEALKGGGPRPSPE